MAFLLCLVLAYMIQKAWQNGRLDHEYAKQGLVSPRLQAKYGDGAAAKTSRYGLGDYVADAWSDMWANRTEIRRSAVKAAAGVKPSKAGAVKPSWRDRLGAVKRAVVDFGKKVVEPVEVRPRREVRPEPAPAPEPAAEPVPVDDVDTSRTCPDCGARLTAQGGDWWHPDGPTCPEAPKSTGDATPVDVDDHTPDPEPAPTQPIKNSGGVTVAGEAVNYEATVAELEALIKECQAWLDSVSAALKSVEDAKNHISDAQGAHRSASPRAAGILEHLAAMHLDTHTLGLISAIKEALPASAVDEILALLEETEARLQKARDDAAAALEAAQAALAHVVAEYGEEAAKVAANLGGDPTFLGSGGGGSAAPAAPVGSAAP